MIFTSDSQSLQFDPQNSFYQLSRKSIKEMLRIDQSFDCSIPQNDDSPFSNIRHFSFTVVNQNMDEKLQQIEGHRGCCDYQGRDLKKINDFNRKAAIKVQLNQELQKKYNYEEQSNDFSSSESNILRLLDPNLNSNSQWRQANETCLVEEAVPSKCKAVVINNQAMPNERFRQIKNTEEIQQYMKSQIIERISIQRNSEKERKVDEAYRYVKEINEAQKCLNPKYQKKNQTKKLQDISQPKGKNIYDDAFSFKSLRSKTSYGLKMIKRQFEKGIKIVDRRIKKSSRINVKNYQYLWKLGQSVTCWKSLNQPQGLLELYICQARLEGNRILQYLPPHLETFKNNSPLIAKIQRGLQLTQLSKEQIQIELLKGQFANQIVINFQAIIFDLVLNFNRNYNKTILIDLVGEIELKKERAVCINLVQDQKPPIITKLLNNQDTVMI